MKTIVILTQRDMLGTIAEFTLMLADDENRLPLDTADRLPEAMRRASELRREHRAAGVALEGV